MKTVIVTAADEKFSALLLELISSLTRWDPKLSDAIGVLDVGLSESTLEQVRQRVTHVVIPDWDLTVDPSLRASAPHLRALLVRPFLRKYFPGYDIYLWLDADTWLQERFAVEWFFRSAMDGAIGIVPEIHQSYVVRETNALPWRRKRLNAYFGERGLALSAARFTYNAGAFALGANSPHWRSWARYFEIGLNAAPELVCDQTALNFAIWNDNLPVHPLPALCNWCCHFAIPATDIQAKKFCEPHIPNQTIGLIHMSAGTRDTTVQVNYRGKSLQTSLRFGRLTSHLSESTELRDI